MAVGIAFPSQKKATEGVGLELLGSQHRHKHSCYCVGLSVWYDANSSHSNMCKAEPKSRINSGTGGAGRTGFRGLT